MACYKKLCPLTNFCPYQLAHAKNGDYFFLFEGEGGEGFLILFSLVPNVFPNKFPKCSQMHSLEVCQVPKLFPKVFPKAIQFYPIWFAQSSTLMSINWKGFSYKGIHLFLVCNLGSKEMLPLGKAQCSKIFIDGPMSMALLKNLQKKKVMSTPMN